MAVFVLRWGILNTSLTLQRKVELRFITTSCVFGKQKVLRRRPIRVVDGYEEKKSLQNLNSLVGCDTGILAGSSNDRYLPFPRYEKLKENDDRFTKVLTMVKCENVREKMDKLLLEGARLINDAVISGVKLETLFFSKEKILAKINTTNLANVKLYQVLYNQLKIWSCLDTCPGIMGVFKKPSTDDLIAISEPALPVTIICHNIKDHKIMGSIMRNAAAAGCKCILLTSGCINVWNQKVLRSACGGHFRIPIVDGINWSHLASYISDESMFYVIDANTGMDHGFETEDFVDCDGELSVKNKCTVRNDGYYINIDESFEDAEHLEKYQGNILTELCYSDVCYSRKDIVLFINGSGSVADPRVMKLAYEFGGYKLKIPSKNKMSLEISTGFPVILYEMKRQCVEQYVI